MPVKIFLAVKAKEGRADQVQHSLKKLEEVIMVCTVSDGPYDVVALVEVPTLEEYKSFSIDKVGSVHHVIDYTSFIAIEQ
ncbi:MAG: Lrp/AsnC family transcriptional regulator [Promethearchaeota archaeon]